MREENLGVKEETKPSVSFIEQFIAEDLKEGKNKGKIVTRFPPEPNGYLHIGHAKAICLAFGMAKKYGGKCNLRFDDTNPVREDVEYIDSIKEDIHWLGFDWERLCYASDYFSQLYEWALQLVKNGKAYRYVCFDSAQLHSGHGWAAPGQSHLSRGGDPDRSI